MKIRIDKTLREGKYFIYVKVCDFNPKDIEKMEKFGVPNIDFSPKTTWHNNRIVKSLPLNEIKHIFVFNNLIAANAFEINMRSKIETAIKRLRSLRDNFSDSGKEYEF